MALSEAPGAQVLGDGTEELLRGALGELQRWSAHLVALPVPSGPRRVEAERYYDLQRMRMLIF